MYSKITTGILIIIIASEVRLHRASRLWSFPTLRALEFPVFIILVGELSLRIGAKAGAASPCPTAIKVLARRAARVDDLEVPLRNIPAPGRVAAPVGLDGKNPCGVFATTS